MASLKLTSRPRIAFVLSSALCSAIFRTRRLRVGEQTGRAPSLRRMTMITRLEDKELKRQSRRQLLKLAPVAALGVFAIPKVNERLVAAGVRFSDWASGGLFRSQHP